jgi:hypothetical protein
MGGVITSAIISGVLFWPAHYLFPRIMVTGHMLSTPDWASLVGLVMHRRRITNYYTSMYCPVQKIARASETVTQRTSSLCWSARHRAPWFHRNRYLVSFHFGGL